MNAYNKLMAPKGIGPVTAYTVLALMPELDSISPKEPLRWPVWRPILRPVAPTLAKPRPPVDARKSAGLFTWPQNPPSNGIPSSGSFISP